MKTVIPVYNICSISKGHHQQDLLVERLDHYLEKNYQKVHTQHGHDFYHLVLFTRGSGSHIIDFTSFTVQPYQLYFMAPGQVHSWYFRPGVDGYIVHFSAAFFHAFLLDHDYLERFPFFSGESRDQVIDIPPDSRKQITEIFGYMLADVTRHDMVRTLLLQLFLLTEKIAAPRGLQQVPQQKQLVLRNFRQLINKHFRSIKLPKQYAELLYITPNHLNALCQELLGRTAGELIRQRILLEAKRMLTNADMTVTQIAYDLNFQDNSYFNRFFRKYQGITPDDFRKSLK